MPTKKTIFYNRFLAEGRAGPRPSVRRLIREARDRGTILAIATTTSRVNVQTLLERCFPESEGSWAVLVCGEDVRRKKPDPEVYLLALGDSENGIRAAVAAGIPPWPFPVPTRCWMRLTGRLAWLTILASQRRPVPVSKVRKD
ncbi:HAD hydrolase-like protein [Desulfonatronum sp. SC1]|uniref:HAD hydrolase-like protein n=1 Tax=Desulfonatronum sp. SC1 TaxID=2109626 RepID=UPI000D314BA2|nr:HAD hydrolase-like protein [Desulfonatronum sp. SC1]PTN31568.1 hypothetical protein C6366_17910 [Desulfonatronum sp. SC1]